jgi:homoserine dehydrogenase
MILGDDLNSMLKNNVSGLIETSLRKQHNNVSLSEIESVLSKTTQSSTTTAASSFSSSSSTTSYSSEIKQPADLEKFLEHIRARSVTPHTILIDTSTSHEVASLHPIWLRDGAHVVTANKRALASSLELYNAIYSEVRSSSKMYMSEVTIGASLPIRTTLNDILCSGDAVHSIVGLMSVSVGTILTYICDNKMSFTEALLKTYKQGLFEDDVFLDLDGSEAAEKLLILGRELGFAMRREDILVEPLAARREIKSWTNFSDTFAEEDSLFAKKAFEAASHGCTLRYVQRIICTPPAELGIRNGLKVEATVRLEEVPLDSIYALVKGPVYHFSFHTSRYSQSPLIVQVLLLMTVHTLTVYKNYTLHILHYLHIHYIQYKYTYFTLIRFENFKLLALFLFLGSIIGCCEHGIRNSWRHSAHRTFYRRKR